MNCYFSDRSAITSTAYPCWQAQSKFVNKWAHFWILYSYWSFFAEFETFIWNYGENWMARILMAYLSWMALLHSWVLRDHFTYSLTLNQFEFSLIIFFMVPRAFEPMGLTVYCLGIYMALYKICVSFTWIRREVNPKTALGSDTRFKRSSSTDFPYDTMFQQ